MKKLLVAIAVVASIGVTLSENNVVSLNNNRVNVQPKYVALVFSGLSSDDAMDGAATAYYCYGCTLAQARAI